MNGTKKREMKLEFDKKYLFSGYGTAKAGKFQQTIGKDSEGETYHLFVVCEGARFYPKLITDSQIISGEEQELYDLLSDPNQHRFYENVLAWHNKWKN